MPATETTSPTGLRERSRLGVHGEHLVSTILQDNGSLATGASCPMTDAQIIEVLRLMIRSRLIDERGVSYQRQGRIGTFSENRGQEGASAGSAMALDIEVDWMVQSYRELPVLLRMGMPLEQYWTLFIGHPDGWKFPDNVNAWPLQIELGTQMPQAVGMAWGLQLQKKPGVVVGYIGDGATSEGDFYEAGNLAGLTKAPTVFFVQNNQWAISTPRNRQTAATSIAAKAAGWGVPGYVVDGNDVFAVYETMAAAVDSARRGEGPTLIEAQTYRMGAHNTSDSPDRYRDRDELETHGSADPIARLRTYATNQGLWDDEREEALTQQVYGEIEESFKAASERAKVRTPSMLFDHVYHEPPERLLLQRKMIEEESEL